MLTSKNSLTLFLFAFTLIIAVVGLLPLSFAVVKVKITAPKHDQHVLTGKDLIVTGITSSNTTNSNVTKNCHVEVIVNNVKPYHTVNATGPAGKTDYSKWSFALTHKYTTIKAGPNNKITAKYICIGNPQSFYSVNVTGVASLTAPTTTTTAAKTTALPTPKDNVIGARLPFELPTKSPPVIISAPTTPPHIPTLPKVPIIHTPVNETATLNNNNNTVHHRRATSPLPAPPGPSQNITGTLPQHVINNTSTVDNGTSSDQIVPPIASEIGKSSNVNNNDNNKDHKSLSNDNTQQQFSSGITKLKNKIAKNLEKQLRNSG